MARFPVTHACEAHAAQGPCAGESMRARWPTTILPAMTLAEAIETTRIHSVAVLTRRPHGVGHDPPVSRAPPHHLRCGADRRGPRADARRGLTGAPRHALLGDD